MGLLGRYAAVDAAHYRPGRRVVVRTSRGLEIGEVLAPPSDHDQHSADGDLLRGMTVADELLAARLAQNRERAYEACASLLRAREMATLLVDVEHLFDGATLAFYFLGEPPAAVAELLAELAHAYDAEAQISQFADLLTQGCGPGCGTESATGSGCTSCATGCAVAGACSVPRIA